MQLDDPRSEGLTHDYIKEFGLDEAIRRLVVEGYIETRVILAQNIHTPPALLAILARDSAVVLRKAVADNPNANAETLAVLAVDPVPGVRRRARGNINLPASVPDEVVSEDGDWELSWHDPYPDPALWGQALLSWLPENEGRLGELATSPHFVVRETVLRNPKTPLPQLIEAASDPDPAIRAAVAANPATPPELQRILARSPEWYVRWELAQNEKAAPDVLLILIETGDWKIWEDIANHPCLRKRPVMDVAGPARASSDAPFFSDPATVEANDDQTALFTALFRTGHPRVLPLLADIAHTPSEIKTGVAAQQSLIAHLCHLAETQPLTEELAVAYAKDFRRVLRKALARNPSLPSAAQDILIKDESWGVVEALSRTECLRPEIYCALAERNNDTLSFNLAKNSAISLAVIEVISRHPNCIVRAFTAARHDLSPEIIQRLHKDTNREVLRSIEGNREKGYRGYCYIEPPICGTPRMGGGRIHYRRLLERYGVEDDDPPELLVQSRRWSCSAFE